MSEINYHQLYQRLATFLPESEVDMHCRILLEDVRRFNRTATWLEDAIQRLEANEPIQYILGTAHFYGRDFGVDPSVLIPRQETEELMVWARDETPKASSDRPIQGLDIGSGSGCLALSLYLEWKEKGIVSEWKGVDVSQGAVIKSQLNAKGHGVDWKNVHFTIKDIRTAEASDFSNLDLIISNPPYVPPEELAGMQPQVRDHEPHLALFTPKDDPLLFFRVISRLGKSWLKPGGLLFFEGHMDHMQAVADLLTADGWQGVMLRKDLNGRDRMIRAVNR